MNTICFCCGSRLAEPAYVPSPRCPTCTQGCKLVEPEKLQRGPSCPFLLRKARLSSGAGLRVVPNPPPEVENAPVRETVRTGALATGVPPGADFVWRGRARRNIPGG